MIFFTSVCQAFTNRNFRFCVDSDVSRIEEADKRTFDTIAQFSHNVPVFVIGTKKDKLVAFHKIRLLESYMEKTGDYHESKRLADEEANKLAEEQFLALRDELSQIKHYKADGYCCLSKGSSLTLRSGPCQFGRPARKISRRTD